MSIMRCDECDKMVDTDYFPMETEETKYGDKHYCEACAEKILEEKEVMEHRAGIHEQQATK